jgi:hypothetical protein
MRNYKPVPLTERMRFTQEQQEAINWHTLENCKQQLEFLIERDVYLKRKMVGFMTDAEERVNDKAYKHNKLEILYNESTMSDILDGTYGENEDDDV